MGVWLGMRIGSRRVVLMPRLLRMTDFCDKARASDGLKNDKAFAEESRRKREKQNFILSNDNNDLRLLLLGRVCERQCYNDGLVVLRE